MTSDSSEVPSALNAFIGIMRAVGDQVDQPRHHGPVAEIRWKRATAVQNHHRLVQDHHCRLAEFVGYTRLVTRKVIPPTRLFTRAGCVGSTPVSITATIGPPVGNAL